MTLSVGVLVRYASSNALVAMGMLVAILAVVPVATVSANDNYWKVRPLCSRRCTLGEMLMNKQTLFPGAMLSSTACSVVYNVLSIVAVAVVPTKSKGLAGQYIHFRFVVDA